MATANTGSGKGGRKAVPATRAGANAGSAGRSRKVTPAKPPSR